MRTLREKAKSLHFLWRINGNQMRNGMRKMMTSEEDEKWDEERYKRGLRG